MTARQRFLVTFCTRHPGGRTRSCVAKSASLNGQCVSRTSATSVERFVGGSGAAATTAIAHVPN